MIIHNSKINICKRIIYNRQLNNLFTKIFNSLKRPGYSNAVEFLLFIEENFKYNCSYVSLEGEEITLELYDKVLNIIFSEIELMPHYILHIKDDNINYFFGFDLTDDEDYDTDIYEKISILERQLKLIVFS
jgi:hypothetical protein